MRPVKDAGFVIDPSSATAVVYNAAARQFFAAIQWHGIYSSSDGATWNHLNNQPCGLSPVSCPATPSTSTCPGITLGNYTITVTGAVGSVTRTVKVGLTMQ